MNSDSPITEKTQDLFGRYSYAQEITKGLLSTFKNGQDSIAIGINGEWGSGKTSLMEFIKKEIDIQTSTEPTKTIIFNFNPWIFSGQTDLETAFLTKLGVHLGAINPELKQLGEDIIFITTLIEAPNKFNPDVHSKFLLGGTTGIIKRFIKRLIKEPTISKLKNKIDDELSDTKIKVFIFIDDIDRLIPNEILNIFRLVKLNANFHNTFFFLAYDKSAVIEAIQAELGVNGGKFIEKIIQLDYSLPKLSDDFCEAFFFSQLEKLGKDLDIVYDTKQLSRLWNLGLSSFYINLRQIYRFFNAFEIRFPSIRDDINFIDFIGIETLRLFDYPIYEYVYKHKSDLISERDNFFDAHFNKEKKSFKELLEEDEELKGIHLNEGSKKLMIQLFDALHRPVPDFMGEKMDEPKLEKDKRIVHKDYFDHYFTLRISNRNVPQAVITTFFVASIEGKTKILNEYLNVLFSVLVRRIGYHISQKDYNQDFVKFFLDYSDSKFLEDSQLDMLNSNGLFIIINMLNEVSTMFGYEELFSEIFTKSDSYSRLYFLGQMSNRLQDRNNFHSVKDFPIDMLRSNADKIQDANKKCVNAIAQRCLSEPFNYPISRVNESLRLLAEYEHEKYLLYISKYFEDDQKSVLLFYCSLTFSTMGGHMSYFIQDDKYILPEMTIKRFDERLSKIDLDKYEGENKDILRLFYHLKSNNFPEHISYTIDLKEVRI